jgi:hypothetical protein
MSIKNPRFYQDSRVTSTLTLPNQIWEEILMYFIIVLPKLEDKDPIFLVGDRLKKLWNSKFIYYKPSGKHFHE